MRSRVAKVRAAFELQRDALALWRGPALADLEHEPFAQIAIERLEEIRLAALEQRVDAELALGRHRELVGELDELAAQHPFHEPFALRLMLALYRSGRQADALDVYRRTRERLVDGFGIEPGRELRELERAILNQDPSLDVGSGEVVARPVGAAERMILVLPSDDERLDALLAVAEPLARLPGRALLIARLLPDEALLASTAAALGVRRASLGVEARTAAFTTVDRVGDTVRLATAYDVQLVLLAPSGLDADALPADLAVDRGTIAGRRRPAHGLRCRLGVPATACASRSAGASTTGRRSSWGPRWRRASRRPFGWWARGRTPDGVDGTRAACSPTRRSRSSEPPESMPCLCSSTPPRPRSSRR